MCASERAAGWQAGPAGIWCPGARRGAGAAASGGTASLAVAVRGGGGGKVVTVTVGPEAGAVPVGSGGPRDVEFAQFFRAEHSKLIRFVMATGAGGDEAAEIAQVTSSGHSRAGCDPGAAGMDPAGGGERADCCPAGCAPPDAACDAAGRAGAGVDCAGGGVYRRSPAGARGAAELPPRQRQVMAWIIDGFGAAEIARELGVSPESVRQSYARARKNLGRFYGRRKRR